MVNSVVEAVDSLRRGGVALVPTETVVGLVSTEAGLFRIKEIKGRDSEKPISLLCRSVTEAFSFAENAPPLAHRLAEDFWPGPLTLVLATKTTDVGGESSRTIGVRVPRGKVREILDAFGGPLYATSANLSGESPARSLSEVDPRVVEAVDAVVAGEVGEIGGGEASAVVDLSGASPRLLRPGPGLTEERLRTLDYGPD